MERYNRGDGAVGTRRSKERDGGRERAVTEYALRGATQPIGVSAYTLTEALPERLQRSLPTIEELEATLGDTE